MPFTWQIDATDYKEIATIDVDGRNILDLAVDSVNNSLALVTIEYDSMNSATRVYEVGRVRSKVCLWALSSFESSAVLDIRLLTASQKRSLCSSLV